MATCNLGEDVHPEHKSSIDWLNENTNDNINFYVFKAVIEKIGDSDKIETFEFVNEQEHTL